jgi:deoxyhypusine synthase
MIDCIVTTCGGIEEDIMKCMGTFHLGEFNMNDVENRLNGHCRMGNILVPNDNYVKLENFLLPLFAQMATEQEKQGTRWTPSKFIRKLGQEINNPESIYYWCYRNDIPVFCPAITDGAIGDVLFTNSYKNDLAIDVVLDHKEISKIAMKAEKAGAIVLGGGIPKHHILNANIWRNGLDYAAYINTGLYEDGSDSGAKAS